MGRLLGRTPWPQGCGRVRCGIRNVFRGNIHVRGEVWIVWKVGLVGVSTGFLATQVVFWQALTRSAADLRMWTSRDFGNPASAAVPSLKQYKCDPTSAKLFH